MYNNIEKIDKNFMSQNTLGKDLVWHNISEEVFHIHGVMRSGDLYTRMPVEVARATSDGVCELNYHTAGGKVRFCTDSPFIALKVKYNHIYKMSHFPLTGSTGFDMYSEDDTDDIYYINTFIPPFDVDDNGFETCHDIQTPGMHQYHINFPLYTGVSELYIGVSPNSHFGEINEFEKGLPIVFYGSSVTQGGCASRPGNNYPNVISRELKKDFINLGWSGNAKGEEVIANYIADIPMSLFFCGYDHNATEVEYLAATHEKFVRIIRNKNPDLPIVMATRARWGRCTEEELRFRDVVKATYDKMVSEGDKNLAFIDGSRIYCGFSDDSSTVDGCHPNDFGFFRMGKVSADVIKKILK